MTVAADRTAFVPAASPDQAPAADRTADADRAPHADRAPDSDPAPDSDRAAVTRVPLHPLLAERWSPRGFDPSHVLSREDLVPLLEAARWAPSAGNTQPTRLVVALRGEPLHERLMAALNPGNRAWADRAAALLVVVALEQDETGRGYPHALHDAGQAVAHLSLQAGAEGLHVHQMAGFDADAVRAAADLAPVQRPVVVVALGARGGEPLTGRLAERETAPRTRRPLEELLLPGEPAA